LGVKQRLEQLVEARQARQMAALDHLMELLTPEEEIALVATLEADLHGKLVPQEIEKQMDVAFERVWMAVTPEERSLLISNTIAEAW